MSVLKYYLMWESLFLIYWLSIQHASPGQEMHEIYTSVKNDTLTTEAVCYDNNVYFICTKAHNANIASNYVAQYHLYDTCSYT
jgi:hypothetical protein